MDILYNFWYIDTQDIYFIIIRVPSRKVAVDCNSVEAWLKKITYQVIRKDEGCFDCCGT